MSKSEKLFKFMVNGDSKTSLQISKHIKTVCTGTMVADLRKRGCDIPHAKFIRKTSTGAMVYEYVMLSWPNGLYGVGL